MVQDGAWGLPWMRMDCDARHQIGCSFPNGVQEAAPWPIADSLITMRSILMMWRMRWQVTCHEVCARSDRIREHQCLHMSGRKADGKSIS